MATNWYYRLQNGKESDPVQFRELAGLIRRGEIEPATEVHPEYDPEWRSAEDVVGLIYTSRRIAEIAGDDLGREDCATAEVQENEVEPIASEVPPTICSQSVVVTSSKPSSWIWYLFAWLPGGRRTALTPPVDDTALGTSESGIVATAPSDDDEGQLTHANLATAQPQSSANDETELVTQTIEPTDNPDECDSGTTFDVIELFGSELAEASVESPKAPAATNAMELQDDHFRGASSNENHPAELRTAINDAVENWDQNHRQTAQTQPHVSSRTVRTGLLALLVFPRQWLERLLLRVLKVPIEIVGWMVLRGDKLVTQVADRVGHELFLLGFRLLAAIVGANAVVFAIEAMESHEALRFPGWQQERNVRTFPIVGECSPFEYWFLTIDVAIVVGVVAYQLAKRVEFSSDP
mgnify:FL=1|tara:strand:+ start:2521 stop:3747 length:1227 start_codon:yes stop_codon:yes gene_type:complete